MSVDAKQTGIRKKGSKAQPAPKAEDTSEAVSTSASAFAIEQLKIGVAVQPFCSGNWDTCGAEAGRNFTCTVALFWPRFDVCQ